MSQPLEISVWVPCYPSGLLGPEPDRAHITEQTGSHGKYTTTCCRRAADPGAAEHSVAEPRAAETSAAVVFLAHLSASKQATSGLSDISGRTDKVTLLYLAFLIVLWNPLPG